MANPVNILMQQEAYASCLEHLQKEGFLSATGVVLGYAVIVFIE